MTKTRVGFGRIELSLFRDLQDGHGFMVIGVLKKSTKWKRKIEKTRVGFGRTEVSIPSFSSFFFEIYEMSMVSGP